MNAIKIRKADPVRLPSDSEGLSVQRQAWRPRRVSAQQCFSCVGRKATNRNADLYLALAR